MLPAIRVTVSAKTTPAIRGSLCATSSVMNYGAASSSGKLPLPPRGRKSRIRAFRLCMVLRPALRRRMARLSTRSSVATGSSRSRLEGKRLWQTSVGTKTHGWGSATSPVLFENLVIVNASVESGQLVALDEWAAGLAGPGHGPILEHARAGQDGTGSYRAGGQHEKRLAGIRSEDWQATVELRSHRGLHLPECCSRMTASYTRSAAGQNTAIAVKAGGRGDVTESHRLWNIRKGSNVSSPVYYEGYLYWVNESRGTAYCVNAKTGEVAYEQRLEPRPERFYASPVVADGKIYLVNRSTGTYVLAAQPEFKQISHIAPLDDSIFNASPAVAEGTLLLRSDKFLYCVAPNK